MNEDKLAIGLCGLKLALDTAEVAGIVSVRHAAYMPHQSGFVSGVISLRGEPVAVVDVSRAFDCPQEDAPDKAPSRKVIVVKDASRTLGLDVGAADVYFLWTEELKKSVPGESRAGFAKGTIELDRDRYIIIDWRALFDEAARVLATEESHV
ncbi:MAG: chemotaxis protein CheW [Deltaproteobacteria bacterium]|nr:chemotaxis protein CheW [Deltaproteobacteria bacterium]